MALRMIQKINSMKSKHVTLNRLIVENNFKAYLEIGIAEGHNFRAIVCQDKIGVEPDPRDYGKDNEFIFIGSSDDFFKNNKQKFDLIFIDGLHHADQVEKDILNAWDCLSSKGMMVLHDINPFTEQMQLVPRKQDQWTGDVWRAFVGLRATHDKIKTAYLPDKYGLGIIYKSRNKITEGFCDTEMYYQDFEENKASLLGFDEDLIKEYS